MDVDRLNKKLEELKLQFKKYDELRIKNNILFLAQMAYDRGDKESFKFAEQDLKILGL